MHEILRKIPLILLPLLFAGCAGPLMINYTPPPPVEAIKLEAPGSILIKPFVDAREPTSYPLVIGDISVTVSDIIGTKLTLDRNPTSIVTEAFGKELATAGYTVIDSGKSDYVLSGELKEFRLDLGHRDEIAIEIYSRLEGVGGEIIWEGVKRESGDRYAGVMGNSRRTISNYISLTLAKAVRASIREATALSGPTAPPTAARAKPAQKRIAPGKGRLTITTDPEHAKIYLDDVYYGLTPNSIDIKPGIYELTLKKAGRADYSEKVAIRDGEVTVLEAAFGDEAQ
jgi:hypothetical protein